MSESIQPPAVYLDCFAGHLTALYGRHGFEPVATVANWTPGGPDVVYMSLPGYADRHGQAGQAPYVHLHSSHASPNDPAGCPTVCGLDCESVDTAYQALDPERVTCPTCLPSVGKARRTVVRP